MKSTDQLNNIIIAEFLHPSSYTNYTIEFVKTNIKVSWKDNTNNIGTAIYPISEAIKYIKNENWIVYKIYPDNIKLLLELLTEK